MNSTQANDDFIRVFVSYTHDSRAHSKRVLNLSNDLRNLGFDCDIDQYHVNEDWPAWMERRIAWADFVVVICSPTYLRRWNNEEEPNTGLGAQWESLLTRQHLYESPGINNKFVPAFFESEHKNCIPVPLRNVTRVDLSQNDLVERLRKRLLGIAPAEKPPIRTSLAPIALAKGFFRDEADGSADVAVNDFGLREEPEDVFPNLFEVSYPPTILTAKLSLRKGTDRREYFSHLWSSLGKQGPPPADMWIEDRVLYTFRDLNDEFIAHLVRVKAIHSFNQIRSAVLAESPSFADKNRFIKLLNRALDQICSCGEMPHRIAWSKDMKCHLFVANAGQTEGRLKVRALEKDGTRVVYKAVPNEDGNGIQHWQHQAFRHYFVRFGTKWYLNLIPFWAFTSDGNLTPSRWQKSSSRNMRKPERNRAVLGHVMFWAAILCREPDLIRSVEGFQIKRPNNLPVTPSISDKEWMQIAKQEDSKVLQEDFKLQL